MQLFIKVAFINREKYKLSMPRKPTKRDMLEAAENYAESSVRKSGVVLSVQEKWAALTTIVGWFILMYYLMFVAI